MTQLTVRDADKHLGNAPKQETEARGWSANKLFLQLLRESVGLLPQSRPAVYTGLDPLAGVWSDEEAAEFEQRLAQQRTLDPKFRFCAGH